MVIHATPQHDRPRPSTKSLRVVSSFRAAESLAYMPEGLASPRQVNIPSVLSNSKVLPNLCGCESRSLENSLAFVCALFCSCLSASQRTGNASSCFVLALPRPGARLRWLLVTNSRFGALQLCKLCLLCSVGPSFARYSFQISQGTAKSGSSLCVLVPGFVHTVGRSLTERPTVVRQAGGGLAPVVQRAQRARQTPKMALNDCEIAPE